MLIVVDGSGELLDSFYMEANAGSFAWQLFSQSTQAPKHYFRGPSTLGFSSNNQSIEVASLIGEWTKKYLNQKVYLAGHSRGGAICIQAARLLRPMSIDIECLVLLDAVQRVFPWQQLVFDAETIPDNVKNVLHPVRSP